MSTHTSTVYRSSLPAGHDGFAHLLRAEWTKFRTVRGWVVAMAAAVLVIVLLGVLLATGSHTSCSNGPVEVACPAIPLGPDGEAVNDKLSFVHRSLTGNGAITVRVTSLTGLITYPPPDHDKIVPGVEPWAKAGVIIKDGIRQGSAYTALMMTGGRGVRMQQNFTQDTAGRPGGVSPASPRWLRLTRSGDTITGEESTDGTHWTTVDTVHQPALPATVRIGLFVDSPGDLSTDHATLGGSVAAVRLAMATAVFDHVSLNGSTLNGSPLNGSTLNRQGTGDTWSWADIGAVRGEGPGGLHHPGSVQESGGTYTVTGNGDIGPWGAEGAAIERTLTGAFVGLIAMIVVAAMFVTAEYRRGLIRTTLLASPRRGRVLAAKAIVIGAVTFSTGLAAAAVAVPLGAHLLRAGGNVILPVPPLTELRVVVGTAVVLALAAVLALALGAVFRRSVPAVTAAIVVTVAPYLLATASVLPLGAAQWLLRLTPAAGFAIQQSIPEYPQVIGNYSPSAGYYPLAPWAGLAVLCGYTALALGLAAARLRRTDV